MRPENRFAREAFEAGLHIDAYQGCAAGLSRLSHNLGPCQLPIAKGEAPALSLDRRQATSGVQAGIEARCHGRRWLVE